MEILSGISYIYVMKQLSTCDQMSLMLATIGYLTTLDNKQKSYCIVNYESHKMTNVKQDMQRPSVHPLFT